MVEARIDEKARQEVGLQGSKTRGQARVVFTGSEEIEIWEEIERISHEKKLRIIAKHLKLSLDSSKLPFQTIRKLFGLRDMLAHGRTATIADEYETSVEPSHGSPWRIHEWEKLTADLVEKYATCVREAVEMINAARGSPDADLWNRGMQGRKVEMVPEKESNHAGSIRGE